MASSSWSFPEDASILSFLRACTKHKDLLHGSRIHGHVLAQGWLLKDIRIGNSLISLYAKCGATSEAQAVFDDLPCRDLVSWNALITGYSQQPNCGNIAVKCFEDMKQEGFSPNAVTFLSTLRSCSSSACDSRSRNVEKCEKGRELHACILSMGLLEENVLIGSSLVDMYAKSGDLTSARSVFDVLRERNVVTWTSMISGCAQHGYGREAISLFEEMQREGISPNPVTFLCILKACAKSGLITKGEEIHAQIMREGFQLDSKHKTIGNALVDMYAKCGAFGRAEKVFGKLSAWNVVSWTALISGYVQHGRGCEALECFDMMGRSGFCPNATTYLSVLRACGLVRAIGKGEEIHAEIVEHQLLEHNICLGNALIDMYAKCGSMEKAEKIFENLCTHRNEVSWNTLIGGYTQNGSYEEAIDRFEEMKRDGPSPNVVTFLYVSKACGRIQAVDKARAVHDEIMGRELLGKESSVGAALVGMYADCADLVRAQQVFDQLHVKDVVCWTTLIAGYAQQGYGEKASMLLEAMQNQGVSLNRIACVSILKACGSAGAIDIGKEIHIHAVNEGLVREDITIGNALVEMYAKCGAPATAQEVFDDLPAPDVASWNALMAGFHTHGSEEVLGLFRRMQLEGLCPDTFTFITILKACSGIGALDKGIELHATIASSGTIYKCACYYEGHVWQPEGWNLRIGNALLDMYANCGMPCKAQEIFDHLKAPDVVSWTTLIAAYSRAGKDEEVVDWFGRMLGEGMESDSVTFTVVLNACSHLGLLEKAQLYFEAMSSRCGFVPAQEHHSCMVDLLGRAGRFDKAVAMIVRMPMCDYLPAWTALLAACRKWGNVQLGRLTFDHAIQLDRRHAGTYICMSNIYAAAAMQEEAE